MSNLRLERSITNLSNMYISIRSNGVTDESQTESLAETSERRAATRDRTTYAGKGSFG